MTAYRFGIHVHGETEGTRKAIPGTSHINHDVWVGETPNPQMRELVGSQEAYYRALGLCTYPIFQELGETKKGFPNE